MNQTSRFFRVFTTVGMSLLLLLVLLNTAAAQSLATDRINVAQEDVLASPMAMNNTVMLDFSSLPSAQGWTYDDDGTGVPETSVFSVSGGTLHQNTIGMDDSAIHYRLPDVVDPQLPFTLLVRARVLATEGPPDVNAFSFAFSVFTGSEFFSIAISPTRIQDALNATLSTTIDNTQFHNYRLEGTFGGGYQFFVDDVLIATGLPRLTDSLPNQLYLGDSTRGIGGNALAEVTTYSFVQQLPNQPPDCSAAAPSVNTLWPPNHMFVPVNVLGVTDSDGDPVSITINSIFQDEPVDAPGSGNTSPDGQVVGSSTAAVRAERVGGGNGRVYHLSFTANDGQGGTCSGEVRVGVPHNKKDTPVDDGALYDSTVP